MAVYKTKLSGRKISWRYAFSIGPRDAVVKYRQGGFATEREAKDAEAKCRAEIERSEKVKATGTVGHTINGFLDDRGPKLSPKTLHRYRELAAYLHPDLLAMPIVDAQPLDFHREWNRLAAMGGHTRIDKTPRPLSVKTVRNIAGVASSACAWAILYGLIRTNPVSDSRPPSGPKRKGLALAPSQTELLTTAAHGWFADFLECEAGLGIRRGEALALRWQDLTTHPISGRPAVYVARSLCQVKQELIWKGTKQNNDRWVEYSPSVAAAFERRRLEQVRYRAEFPEYDTKADLIFCDPIGAPFKPDSVSSKVSLLIRTLKLPKGVSLHTLRHTHASQLVADGQDIAAVSERMGHSDAHTTLGIYSHSIPGKSDLAGSWERSQGKKPQ